MKSKVLIFISLATLWALTNSMTNNRATESFEPIAVIELFSSQGCSSCPPADRLLSGTITKASKNNMKIFALSFHVDYWDRLGWKDPFSNKKFSERQEAYTEKMNLNSNYTPQMIVNGTNQFVGSDAAKLEKAIEESLRIKPEAAFKKLELAYTDKNLPHIHYELSGNYANCKINIALLSVSEKTVIKRGENAGVTLVNDNIVNQLISVTAAQQGEISFAAAPLPLKNNTRIIAYVQNTNTLKITGASQIN